MPTLEFSDVENGRIAEGPVQRAEFIVNIANENR